jgi:YVTN family beta-propeller protein
MQQSAIAAVALLLLAPSCSSSSDPTSTPKAAVSNRKAYVGLFGDQAVAVLDTVTKQVVKTIPVSAPDGLIVTPDGKKVYVSSTDTGSVQVIATADDMISGSIDVGAKPAGVAVTPDGSRVVVSASGANEAVIIDTASDAIVKHVSVAAAHASCVSADGHYAYVGSQATGAPAIVKVDLLGDTPASSFPVDKSPRMLSCTAKTIYFTAVGVDAVEAMDAATGTLGAPIATGGSPHDVRATPDGKLELVVSQTAGDLELVDVATATVAATLPTGKLAHWISLFADGTGAYVTNEGDNNVVAVDLGTKRVTDTIAIGNGPRKMALQP